MADYAIPKSGVAFIFYTGLVSQADTKLLKSSPTLASGDFKVSIDGGAFANLATLPTNTPSGTAVKISLSAGEMTGDNILVACIDAAGAEWCDQIINIQTAPRGIADLAYPTTSGRSLDVSAGGNAGIDWANVEAPTTTLALTGTTISTSQVITLPTIPSGWITGDGIATDAIDANALSSGALTDIQGAVSAALDAISTTALARFASIDSGEITAVDGSVAKLAQGPNTTSIAVAVEASLAAAHGAGSWATATGFSTHTAANVISLMGTGTFLTALPWNAAWDAEVQSEAADALQAIHLDHLFSVNYDPDSKPGSATALLNELIGSDAGVSQFTANALELAPTGGSAPTAAAIADAVWDEAQADHVAVGSFGITASEIADVLVDTAEIGAAGAGLTALATQVSVNDLPTVAEFEARTLVAASYFDFTTDTVTANVTQISGDSTAADNAELFFDGTGYAGGTTKLAVNIVQINGSAVSLSGTMPADVVSISGDTVAADNLESALDGTGYNVGGGDIVADSVTGAVGSVTGLTASNLDATVSSRASQTSVDTIDDFLDTEIAALTTQLALVKDRVSYCLTILVGACSDAGTAAETYVLAIGGETFTADYTGLDATGNRSTTTLGKV